MKVTLDIDELVLARLRREAGRQGRTLSDLVATALRREFHSAIQPRTLLDTPAASPSGGRFDDALSRALDQALAELGRVKRPQARRSSRLR